MVCLPLRSAIQFIIEQSPSTTQSALVTFHDIDLATSICQELNNQPLFGQPLHLQITSTANDSNPFSTSNDNISPNLKEVLHSLLPNLNDDILEPILVSVLDSPDPLSAALEIINGTPSLLQKDDSVSSSNPQHKPQRVFAPPSIERDFLDINTHISPRYIHQSTIYIHNAFPHYHSLVLMKALRDNN